MAGFFARLFGKPADTPEAVDAAGDAPAPEWASPEAEAERQLRTLEVAYALRTISRERYEEERRRIEHRIAADSD